MYRLPQLPRLAIGILLMFFQSMPAQWEAIDNPQENFDALWETFHKRYANFDLKRVDWNQIQTKYGQQVTPETTNRQLFEIGCAMLQELNDGHVTLEADFEERDLECGPSYTFAIEKAFPIQEKWDAFKGIMDARLKAFGFSEAQYQKVSKDAHFQYRTHARFGYIRIDEMPGPTFGKLDKALNKALQNMQTSEAVILDLRFNGGGWDKNSYTIANRFVNEKKLGHYKETRIKDTQNFTKKKAWYLKPHGKFRFRKKLIILTSDFTASAAEVFLLAMHRQPQVVLIGQTTEGIFSDMYEFKLPNGWEVSLSHMRFYDAQMTNYEGIGIQPAIEVKNSPDDLTHKTDAVLNRAFEYLQTLNRNMEQ
ncbi:S41 family peptidase [Sediminicola luteus]|uniref:Tail specific protease domain-containing protein n=1 Tax=Sediminicola luteus TaxID=319238 RepID=A0A2A4G564_9FLAO|nr:S41 family peptidase [Sediminicola luteus]PCE62875.1 hypothetical protein B7P33_16490 [Sediminicola luteus]